MKWFGDDATKLSRTRALCGKTIEVEGRSFKVEEYLNDGEFAVFYRVRDLASDEQFALKHTTITSKDAGTALTDEPKIMKMVKDHPNVVSIQSIAFGVEKEERQDAFMVMELYTETLVNFLERFKFELQDSQRYDIFLSACKAVQHLHKQQPPVLHRDIKVENILRGVNGNWILSEFGTARLKTQESSSHTKQQDEINQITAPAYRSPEMLDVKMRQPIDEKSDIWALGCLLYLLCYGSLPFTDESQCEVLTGRINLPSNISPRFSKIITEMLEVDPSERPSIDSVIFMLEASNQWTQVVSGDLLESTESSAELELDRRCIFKPQTSLPATSDCAKVDKNENPTNQKKLELQEQDQSKFNEEMMALRESISCLIDNNELLWSKLVSLEKSVQSQKHSILKLQNAEQKLTPLIPAGSIYSPKSELKEKSFKNRVFPISEPVKKTTVIESQSPSPAPEAVNGTCELKTWRNTKWNLTRSSKSARNLRTPPKSSNSSSTTLGCFGNPFWKSKSIPKSNKMDNAHPYNGVNKGPSKSHTRVVSDPSRFQVN